MRPQQAGRGAGGRGPRRASAAGARHLHAARAGRPDRSDLGGPAGSRQPPGAVRARRLRRALSRPGRPNPCVRRPATDASPTAAEPVPSPGPLLQTPQTADESTAERRTRDVLKRATDLLAGVKPETLGQQARQQHETARRFVEQAQQALNDRNYVLAASLADKAETLARGLSR